MFAHAEILMGSNKHRGQTCTYRIFSLLENSAVFLTSAKGRAILCTAVREPRLRCCTRERHEACPLQIYRRPFDRAGARAQGGTWRRREISGGRAEPAGRDG